MVKAAAVSSCAFQCKTKPAPSDQARHGAPRTARTGDCRTAPARQGQKPPRRRQLGPAERRFAETHLNLARSQARRFASRHGLVYEDVLGAAYEGLCKAAMGFDHSRGHRPSSYVVPKVKGELLHYLRDTGFAWRISHRLRELWIRARRPLALGWGDGQIAETLGVPLELWLECRQACGQRPLSLEGELLEDL